MPLTLETERLVLRQATPKFAELTLDFYLKNRDHLAGWGPDYPEDFFTLKGQYQRLRSVRKVIADARQLELWIFKKDRADTLGKVNFFNIRRAALQACVLGYQMDEAHTNNGYITEALREAIRYMFEVQKLHRIEANIMPRNKRSLRVVEKLGFKPEGLRKKYLKVGEVWEDHIPMVLINED
ncbi:GNAT family N-acetyltransferase [Salidesulfovibrio onnuriiensis]|uniref:GNAT family N-acetyltransferase n=1 Tax=Salidesulfovibrio onnuriiensis TaxID=2583823 RepID=UPI0011CC259C|nr:GNAT family N-acetyltransferase [Salidesulfovibrio onnuriiensis]